MARDVVMPALGLTIESGTLVCWRKAEGEFVRKGQVLFEVETEKANQEIEAQVTGFVAKILAEPGTMLPIGTRVAVIAESQGELESIRRGEITIEQALGLPAERPGQPAESGRASEGLGSAARTEPDERGVTGSGERRVPVSPAARRLAEEHQIDLGRVRGTGPGGRITEADVRQVIEGAGNRQPESPSHVELTSIRRLTAQRMSQSFQTAPHFYLVIEVDAEALAAFYREHSPLIQAAIGERLTYTDLLIRALGRALEHHPLLYATWEDGRIRLNDAINISFAVDTERGLVAPVIHEANRLSLADVVRRRRELVTKARADRLSLAETSGGTFTLTNLGMFGVDMASAIINPPQAAILATGVIKERGVVREGSVCVRRTMYAVLSVDHRVAEGVAAAKFLREFEDVVSRFTGRERV